MAFENDPYRDEDGEPLMDFDEGIPSDHDEPQQEDEVWGYADRSQRSPTPVYNDSKAKPRKRLIKKSSPAKDLDPVDLGLNDDEGDYGGDDDIQDVATMVRNDYSDSGKRKGEKGAKRKLIEKRRKGEKGDKKFKVARSGGGRIRDGEVDPEMKEMWDTVAGGDSEDDQEGARTVDDDNFIDDSGVDPADRYGSGNEHSPSRAPQVRNGSYGGL